jgi:hypothetical protein
LSCKKSAIFLLKWQILAPSPKRWADGKNGLGNLASKL